MKPEKQEELDRVAEALDGELKELEARMREKTGVDLGIVLGVRNKEPGRGYLIATANTPDERVVLRMLEQMAQNLRQGLESTGEINSQEVSQLLPSVCSMLDEMLFHVYKNQMAFLLLTAIPNTSFVHYASNVERDVGEKMMQELLAKWEAGMEDIPHHLKGLNS
jgi:hypothetical protein